MKPSFSLLPPLEHKAYIDPMSLPEAPKHPKIILHPICYVDETPVYNTPLRHPYFIPRFPGRQLKVPKEVWGK